MHKQLLMASDIYQAVWSSAKTIKSNWLQFMIKITKKYIEDIFRNIENVMLKMSEDYVLLLLP